MDKRKVMNVSKFYFIPTFIINIIFQKVKSFKISFTDTCIWKFCESPTHSKGNFSIKKSQHTKHTEFGTKGKKKQNIVHKEKLSIWK